MSEFAQGGLVSGGGETRIAIQPDECLIQPSFDGQAVCVRDNHPSVTSGCTVMDWVHHISEDEWEKARTPFLALAEEIEADDNPGLNGEALDAWNAATVRASQIVRRAVEQG